MKTKDAVAHFGSKAAISRILDISPQAVTRWGGIVPVNRAIKLNRISNGKVQLELTDYPGIRRSTSAPS